MDNLEEFKDDVLDKLSQLNVTELGEICTAIQLTIPENKKTKRMTVYRALVKHLTGEEVEDSTDQGEELFKQVETVADQLLLLRTRIAANNGEAEGEHSGRSGTRGGDDTDVKAEEVPVSESTTVVHSSSSSVESNTVSTGAQVSTVSQVSSMSAGMAELSARLGCITTSMSTRPIPTPQMQVHKIREFKIQGGFVGKEAGCVDYVSLSYQIQDGLAKGYSHSEIQGGVVKSMRAGYPLRRVFETSPTMEMKVFLEYLRSDYKVENSGKLWGQLLNAAQEPKQDTVAYVWKLIYLKNLVLLVSKEEGTPMDEGMVKRQFIHALRVGLNNTAVRLEVQSLLKLPLADHELAFQISEIVAREEEHEEKVRHIAGSRKADVSAVGLDSGIMCYLKDKPTEAKDDMILAEIKKIAGSVEEIKDIKKDVVGLSKRMDTYEKKLEAIEKAAWTGKGGGKGKGKFAKCESCEREGKFCTHCNKCGKEGHKRKDCSENC